MNNPVEAYEFTLRQIEDLQREHPEIDVKIVPSRSRDNVELREKYVQPQRIPAEKWVHVTFRFPNDKYWYMIAELRNYLGQCGISFDTGGMVEYRDWELDWSFRYTGEDDPEWRDAANEVDEIIHNLPDESEDYFGQSEEE